MKIHAEQVRKKYDSVTALDGLSLEITTGSTFGVLGTNAAGKTTLFKLLVGLDRSDDGRLTIGDRYVTGSVDPETFVRAAEAVFVVDSGVQGAMGPDLLPFGERAAAETFVDSEGGELVDAADVTPELVSSI